MNDKDNGPVQNLLKALEEVSPSETLDGLKQSLRERGIDVDSAVQEAQRTVNQYVREHRLAWRTQARSKLAQFLALKQGIKSWREESPEKVQSTFEDLLHGRFGAEFGEQAAMAFRNKKEMTTDDKAALLDSLSLLTEIEKLQNGAEEKK